MNRAGALADQLLMAAILAGLVLLIAACGLVFVVRQTWRAIRDPDAL